MNLLRIQTNPKERTQEDGDVDEEEEVNLQDDNPFSFIEDIKISINEEDYEILDDAIEKALKKRTDEKHNEIDNVECKGCYNDKVDTLYRWKGKHKLPHIYFGDLNFTIPLSSQSSFPTTHDIYKQ